MVQDNTQYAFLQMDDRVLVYRGADQPDMSVINPESDVWQRIKVRTQSSRSVNPAYPDNTLIGAPELPGYELADPVLCAESGRAVDCDRGKEGFGTLQLDVWAVEAV